MIGVNVSTPSDPRFVIVNVPALQVSSGPETPSLPRPSDQLSRHGRDLPEAERRRPLRITGTSRPASVSTAIPILALPGQQAIPGPAGVEHRVVREGHRRQLDHEIGDARQVAAWGAADLELAAEVDEIGRVGRGVRVTGAVVRRLSIIFAAIVRASPGWPAPLRPWVGANASDCQAAAAGP